MYYCGLDVASPSSYVYVTDAHGRKQLGAVVATTAAAVQEALGRWVADGLQVALEAGNQTAWIYQELVELGAQVTVVNPTQVKLIATSRRKTDKIDARVLCELLRLGGLPHPVHMPGPQARELRGLLVARRQLVGARTKLSNTVRGLVRQEGVRLAARALTSAVGWERLLEYEGYRTNHLRAIVAAYYGSFRVLSESMRAVEQELAVRQAQDGRVARLCTMPKVGPITALTTVAALDQVARFGSSRQVVSYAGLAPTVRSSGERTEYGSISREGRSELRAVWVQVAHLVVRDTTPATAPLRRWYGRVARRRGPKTAIVALARKLLTIAFRLLKDQATYCPARVSRPAA